jgi:N utilization substance protein A
MTSSRTAPVTSSAAWCVVLKSPMSIVDLGKFEGVMTSKERVSTEDYTPGDRMRFYVKAVEKDSGRGPEIILSRAHPNFVRRLFEFEVSEIGDRTVEIASIAREAGYRTKVAVHSADEKVDPVGACVGLRGARVKNIVRELNNEKVDIIRWKADPAEFVREALKPIKVISIQVNPEKKEARLTVSEEDLSKAIGRRGQNARLTSRLVGMDLVIEKDEHAAEVFEGQMGSAVHHLMEALASPRTSHVSLRKAAWATSKHWPPGLMWTTSPKCSVVTAIWPADFRKGQGTCFRSSSGVAPVPP